MELPRHNDTARPSRTLLLFALARIFILPVFLCVPFACGAGQDPQPSEYQLKAAFLFNFAKFVEWPTNAFATSTAPLVIGVMGDNPFDDQLESTVRGKIIGEHPVTNRLVKSIDEAKACHILFISTSERRRLPEIIAGLGGSPVLTVGETDRFTESGGMINFVIEESKIRFHINDTAARAAGLRISSRLLSLATKTTT